ncbi:MAG: hypothetical protein ACE5GE_06395 [Phycisphaerae bacterium]
MRLLSGNALALVALIGLTVVLGCAVGGSGGGSGGGMGSDADSSGGPEGDSQSDNSGENEFANPGQSDPGLFPPEGGAGGAFGLASVDLPDEVVSNAPRETLSVTWTGDPVFPVRIVFRPTGMGCPGGLCSSPSRVFAEAANPFELPDAVWCEGSGDEVRVFDFEVVMIDATGTESDPLAAPFTCQPAGQQ